MDRPPQILFDAIRAERALDQMPAIQERHRLARLAAEIARCCRLSIMDRLTSALLGGPAIATRGAVR
jgi:hypothetical protein